MLSWRHCVVMAVEQFTWKCSLHVTLWLLKANGRASQTHCSSDASHCSDNFSAFFFCFQKANLMPGSAATQDNTGSGLCQRQTGHAPTWRSPLLTLQLPDRRGHW